MFILWRAMKEWSLPCDGKEEDQQNSVWSSKDGMVEGLLTIIRINIHWLAHKSFLSSSIRNHVKWFCDDNLLFVIARNKFYLHDENDISNKPSTIDPYLLLYSLTTIQWFRLPYVVRLSSSYFGGMVPFGVYLELLEKTTMQDDWENCTNIDFV